jgi:hypothetical protein
VTKRIKLFVVNLFTVTLIILFVALSVMAKEPTKSKFYDFNEQIIDGELRRPMNLYTDARKQVKFERLLRLKKSFMSDLFQTGKERVFR